MVLSRWPIVSSSNHLLHSASERGATWGGPVNDGFFDQPAPPMPEAIAFLGDMNFAYQSEEYQLLAGAFSPYFGRLTAENGLVDAWVASGKRI